jgi:Lrp/AsnC family transcriptional regulator for asnA, asnC and gidA
MKLSKKDKMLINELMDNGRARLSDIGMRCKMSRQTAFNRIRQLTGAGMIDKFTIKPGYSKLGLDFRAYILVAAEAGRKHRESLMKFFTRRHEISQVHYLFGRFDFFLEIVVHDREELAVLLKRIHGFESVKNTETFIVYDTLKYEPTDPVKRVLFP